MPEPTPENPPPSSAASSAKLIREGPRHVQPVGWKRFLPVRIFRTDSGIRVRVLWRRAVVMVVFLGFGSWFGLAGASFLFVKYRRDFPEVKFEHILLYPFKKNEFRVARGDFLISRAKVDLEKQRYREAFYGLRVGSGLSPGNRDGRMLLSQFFIVQQRPDLAQKMLVDGLGPNRADEEYLQALFGFLLQRQEDSEVLRIANELLREMEHLPAPVERVRLVATARATAEFFRGNYDAAEDTVKKYRLQETPDGQILALRIEWDRGERDTALARLQSLTEQIPENEQVYAQYAAYLRETGRDDELRRLCVLRQLSYPDRPRARIDLLYLYDKGKDETNVQVGVEELFRDFPKTPEVMLALADFAANTGRPALARRVYDYCKANNLPWEGPALMTVEAHVVAKEYNEALEACRQMMKDNPEWGKRFFSVFNGLQAIANYGLGDIEAAQLFLSNFLNQAGVRAENLVAVSNRLMSVGAKDQARQVLAQAVRTDPLNQTALVGLIKLDLELGQADTIAASLRALITMRKPPRDLLNNAYTRLASDRFLFAPGRDALLDELRVNISERASMPLVVPVRG